MKQQDDFMLFPVRLLKSPEVGSILQSEIGRTAIALFLQLHFYADNVGRIQSVPFTEQSIRELCGEWCTEEEIRQSLSILEDVGLLVCDQDGTLKIGE